MFSLRSDQVHPIGDCRAVIVFLHTESRPHLIWLSEEKEGKELQGQNTGTWTWRFLCPFMHWTLFTHYTELCYTICNSVANNCPSKFMHGHSSRGQCVTSHWGISSSGLLSADISTALRQIWREGILFVLFLLFKGARKLKEESSPMWFCLQLRIQALSSYYREKSLPSQDPILSGFSWWKRRLASTSPWL